MGKNKAKKSETIEVMDAVPSASEPAVDTGTSADVTAEETPKPTKKKGKAKRESTGAGAATTLTDVFAGYLRALESAGKSEGTIFSYRLELVLAGSELGVDTKLADLTPEKVLLFFTCDRVTKTRSGRAKSPLSIAKTRRVVRQALVWAAEAGLIASAPLPESVATH